MSGSASKSGNTGKKTLEQRIADCIRMMSASEDGVVIAAVAALKRVLASAGTDIHGLAHGVENLGKGISNEERKKIWDTAVQHTENRLHGADEFIDSSGKPGWQAVALYCQRNKHRLNVKHHNFIDKVASQTVYDREPTERMHKYLFSLFLQLGGKII
jgi:hypothetical protein